VPVAYKPRRLASAISEYLATVNWVPTSRIIEVCGANLKTPRTSIREALMRMRRAGLVDSVKSPAPHPALHVIHWTLNRSSRMTLEDAQALITGGVEFGAVFPRVAEGDRLALKGWYCTNPSVPNSIARKKAPVVAGAGYTGNSCKSCSSVRMVRSGSCEMCLECGQTTGCT